VNIVQCTIRSVQKTPTRFSSSCLGLMYFFIDGTARFSRHENRKDPSHIRIVLETDTCSRSSFKGTVSRDGFGF
jgi:hypothetical protein